MKLHLTQLSTFCSYVVLINEGSIENLAFQATNNFARGSKCCVVGLSAFIFSNTSGMRQ